jgi:hypothetical protein
MEWLLSFFVRIPYVYFKYSFHYPLVAVALMLLYVVLAYALPLRLKEQGQLQFYLLSPLLFMISLLFL